MQLPTPSKAETFSLSLLSLEQLDGDDIWLSTPG